MKAVSRQASPKTWTGEIRMKNGALPDLKAWSREFHDVVGQVFSIRGVEVTIDGVVVEEKGHLVLEVSGSGIVLPLAPLERKVQWDPGGKREQPPTAEEREAYQRLVARAAESGGRTPKIRIIGPLKEVDGGPPILTVRDFLWD